ncbi:MAG: PBSX family phage terminase large subunit [Eubacteriales bacterium]|nr:PBSX family phage terminase large subunit [Eubacteriales bacterium]MDD3881413.1 PBSX family phage terminase large subunit [Eubacteriales bacterium]MDD4513100.1 PBSX family phage terminase large subunit [Eubacteriales bacterium]
MRLKLDRGLFNPAYLPYLEDERRFQIFFGGAGSGKSAFVAMRCVLDVLAGRNYLVVRRVARSIRNSCQNEILKAMDRMGVRKLFSVSKAEGSITALNNGKQVLFCGLDDVEKVKSITPQTGALTDIWVEEATEILESDLRQLEKRLRGESRFVKRVTLTFNPVLRTHWIFGRFFKGIWADGEGARLAESRDTLILKTTYRDNVFLTDDDRTALESEKDEYFYRVYTLGEWGVNGSTVFRRFSRGDLKRERDVCSRPLYGLDFGFSKDPCGFVMCAYDEKRQRVSVFRELCERGLTNHELAARLRPIIGGGMLVCDSAEPKSIAELRQYGIRAVPARKGPDSVNHGIQWLQGQDIVADESCSALLAELSAYSWRKGRDGLPLPVPEDENNHLIDALRYALEGEMLKSRARGAKIWRGKESG